MNWAAFFGWVSVGLLGLLASVFILRKINQWFFHYNKKLNKVGQFLGRIHPYAAMLLLITGGIHGYLMTYGHFMMHTGTILFFLIVFSGLLAVLGKKLKFKRWMKIHLIMACLILAALFVHLFSPISSLLIKYSQNHSNFSLKIHKFYKNYFYE